MNTLLLTPAELAAAENGRVRLAADRRVAHVRTVHRAAVGDALRVGVLGGRLGTAVVARLDDAGLELDPPPALPLVLVHHSASARPTRILRSIVRLPSKRTARFSAKAPDFP